jgi:hypothetical protein
MKSFIVFSVAFLLIGCKGQTESQRSDEEKMAEGVRTYFFLDDSVSVSVEVTDTIFTDELDEMLETIDQNLNLVQEDIDTLGAIIDSAAYDNLQYEGTLYPESIDNKMASRRLKVSKLRLKLAELNAKKLEFQQSKRVMLNLRRSHFNNTAGYEIGTSYALDGQQLDFELLMDADFRVID